MLDLRELNKQYKDKKIFSNANFKADTGEIVLLMGKSGIGKTTLLDIISGIKHFDSGQYFFQNKEIFPKDDEAMSAFRNQTIGYILQDFALIEDYTVLDNIALPSLYNKQIDKEQIHELIKELLRKFNLTDVTEQKVKNISGGQKQRVAIIRSLILNPQIILADEPTANLDFDNFSIVMQVFKDLKNSGKIVIISTHDERILNISDKVYRIDNCQLILS